MGGVVFHPAFRAIGWALGWWRDQKPIRGYPTRRLIHALGVGLRLLWSTGMGLPTDTDQTVHFTNGDGKKETARNWNAARGGVPAVGLGGLRAASPSQAES